MMLFLSLVSCYSENPPKDGVDTRWDRKIAQSLINGYYSEINDNLSFSIFQDRILVFSLDSANFSPNQLAIRPELGEEIDNKLEFTRLRDSSFRVFRPVEVFQYHLVDKRSAAIKMDLFTLGTTQKELLWSKKINFDELIENKKVYTDEMDELIGVNLLERHYVEGLSKGIFFEIRNGFYIMIHDYVLYLITKQESDLKSKMMLHFIYEDGSFVNSSFLFQSREIQSYFDGKYANLKIARVDIPYGKSNHGVMKKIRVGQYDEKGNIWLQIIGLEDVKKNELLRYHGEFENLLSR